MYDFVNIILNIILIIALRIFQGISFLYTESTSPLARKIAYSLFVYNQIKPKKKSTMANNMNAAHSSMNNSVTDDKQGRKRP